jgi:hypothetical protein
MQADRLQDYCNQEYTKTVNAQERLGSFNDLCVKSISLLENFVTSVRPDRYLAAGLLITIKRYVSLAYFSYVRGHSVQGDLNSRQVIELCALNAYLLAQPNGAMTGEDATASTLKSEYVLKGAAYSFLETNCPALSTELKKTKELINKSTAHGSVLLAHLNTDFDSDDTILGSFFDRSDDDYTRLNLVRLAKIVGVVLELLCQVAETYGGFTLRNDLHSDLQELDKWIIKHRDTLKDRDNFQKVKRIVQIDKGV